MSARQLDSLFGGPIMRPCAWVLALMAMGVGATWGAEDTEDQQFLKKKIEKQLLNPKQTLKDYDGLKNNLSLLAGIPRGYTTVIKAVDFYRGKATDKQGENRDLWRVRWTWTLRALTQHDAVKRNLKLFPDRMVKDYLVI